MKLIQQHAKGSDHFIPLINLERMIEDRFDVLPQRSICAYERFSDGEGNISLMKHYTFACSAKGRLEDASINSTLSMICDQIYADIEKAWPEKTMLMWRERPSVFEFNDNVKQVVKVIDGEGVRCSETGPDDWLISVFLRIGSIVDPVPGTFKEQGEPVKLT